MSMSEHTPGPWEIYSDGDRKHILRAGSLEFISPSYTKADWIAELDPDGTGHDEDETEANALLIAAAPNMVDQLEKDAERFRDFAKYARDSGWENLAAEFDVFAAETEAVLALAEKGGA